jgi:hypothetical protein
MSGTNSFGQVSEPQPDGKRFGNQEWGGISGLIKQKNYFEPGANT